MNRHLTYTACLLALVAACDDDSPPGDDAGVDAAVDAGPAQDAGPEDAGPEGDAGRADAGLDASTPDDAGSDGGSPDGDAGGQDDAGTDGGTEETGRWTTGDLHTHTIQSNDANAPSATLELVLEAALDRYGLDWIALANHLRMSDRDPTGEALTGGPIPFSRALGLHERPAVQAFLASGDHAEKLVLSSVEWDMPTHEHFNVGILAPASETDDAFQEFEYLFTNRDPAAFDPGDVTSWGMDRFYSTHEDALRALAWLKENFPTRSYGLINHPNRYPDRYTIDDFRAFHDLAPDIVFAFEGMVGNQMEPDRGGYASEYVPANAHARTYGGADSVIAKVGGIWDAMLGEGRRIWNVGNSDHHFKTAQGRFSSGYLPGEYVKNHVWVDGEGMESVLAGLRSGRAFTVYGNLISALDFTARAGGPRQHMGGEVQTTSGSTVRVTIRFKSEWASNYETSVGSGNVPGAIPTVDHVDLIVGDVGERAAPNTPEYLVNTNATSHVAARFDASDWTTDAEGYHVITHDLVVTKDQYIRLRGTNLGVDVAGETVDGEPEADAPKLDQPADDHQTRFDAINDRNYADLWFYSNPIFIAVE